MIPNIPLTIIIVTFNSEKYISNCLENTIKNIPKNWKIVIVDNNSSDNTRKIINHRYGDNTHLKLYVLDTNQGFAKAVNFGISKSEKSGYYLLLNPDVVPNKNSFIPLLKCCKKMKSGICGGTTINEDGQESGSYFRLPNLQVGMFDLTNFRKIDIFDRWHKYFYYQDKSFQKNINCFDVDVVTGGYMLIKSDTIENIGLFDERFFMYLEDVDYCKRAKDKNVNVIHCRDSNVLHYSGKSSQNADGIKHSAWMMSRKKYFIKHFRILENMIIQPIFLIDDLYILINKFLKG